MMNFMTIKGTCCGMETPSDWRNTSIGRTRSSPDSCCSFDYDYRGCGFYIFRHSEYNRYGLDEYGHNQKRMLKPLVSLYIYISILIKLILIIVMRINFRDVKRSFQKRLQRNITKILPTLQLRLELF
jgi:hypothetical protein